MMLAGSATTTIWRRSRLAATLLRRLAALLLAATASDGLAGRVRRLEWIVEQIGSVLLPQNMKEDAASCRGADRGRASAPDLGTCW